MRLRPQAERDRALRDHVETVAYFDEEAGELYASAVPPAVPRGAPSMRRWSGGGIARSCEQTT